MVRRKLKIPKELHDFIVHKECTYKISKKPLKDVMSYIITINTVRGKRKNPNIAMQLFFEIVTHYPAASSLRGDDSTLNVKLFDVVDVLKNDKVQNGKL